MRFLDINLQDTKKYAEREIRTPDPQREPDLKSGAVPLGHLGIPVVYLLSLLFDLIDGLLFADPFLPVLNPLVL